MWYVLINLVTDQMLHIFSQSLEDSSRVFRYLCREISKLQVDFTSGGAKLGFQGRLFVKILLKNGF